LNTGFSVRGKRFRKQGVGKGCGFCRDKDCTDAGRDVVLVEDDVVRESL